MSMPTVHLCFNKMLQNLAVDRVDPHGEDPELPNSLQTPSPVAMPGTFFGSIRERSPYDLMTS